MAKKIVLIDGHSILNRTFFGIPDLTNSEGEHTNAVYGFLGIIFKLVDELSPDYMAVAFDMHAPTFRHKMYKEYKGNRKPPAPEFVAQVPMMKNVLESMNIKCVQKEGYEADDIIGTLAKRANEAGDQAFIVSGDRDLLQLASENATVIIPKTKFGSTTVEHYTPADVEKVYGVTPGQFIDVKALMGDSSDNIPGLPRVGEKTATKLIEEFGSIENIYANLEKVTPEKIQKIFSENKELCDLCLKLVTIDTDAPIDVTPNELTYGDMFNEKSYELYKKLGFKKYLTRFEKKAVQHEIPGFKVIYDRKAAGEIFSRAANAELVGIEAFRHTFEEESDGQITFDFAREKSDKLIAALCFDAENYMFVGDKVSANEDSIGKEDTSRQGASDAKLDDHFIINGLEEIYDKVGCFAALDIKALCGILNIKNKDAAFDCGIAAYLEDPLKSSITYDDIASTFGGVTLPTEKEIFNKSGKDEKKGKNPKGKKLANDDEIFNKTLELAFYKAYTAFISAKTLKEALSAHGMLKLYDKIERPLIFVLHDMENEGILVDREVLKNYGNTLAKRIEELTGKIYKEAGEEFNINSPKQLGNILFEKLGLKGGKKTKTGYSTSADILEKLAPDNEIVADILEYRQLTKLKGTYVDGMGSYICEDGKIHTTFNQTVTATGRLSSSDPNLQNIPMRVELGRLIRKCFIPAEGNVFVDADYSQIELRVLAHMSGDESLIEAYKENRDIHATTASQVFHVPYDEVTPELRRNAKAVNFGIVYGISSFGLGQDLSISRKEAQKYIESYFETYPKIKEFLDGLVKFAKEKGYAISMFGRRRPIPELKNSNFMIRNFGERAAMNSPIQGTAADIMKIAMNNVSNRLKKEGLKSRLILQIHDELIVEAPREEAKKAKLILEEEMVNAARLKVKLEVDCHSGDNWYDVK